MNEFIGLVSLNLRLLGHNKLKAFKLTINPPIRPFREIHNWLRCVVDKEVEELVLDFCFHNQPSGHYKLDDYKFMLPSCVFQSNTIAHLKVSRFNFTAPNGFTGLRFLTKLQLINVNIQDEMLDRLLANCSLMEVLILRGCYNLAYVRISGAKLRLKSLAILDTETRLLEVSAPNLRTFHYNGDSDVFNITNVHSLVDAIVCTNPPFGYALRYNRVRLLSMIRHVEILTICSMTIEDIYVSIDVELAILPFEFTKLHELQILLFEGLEEEITMRGFSDLFTEYDFPVLEKLFIEFENPGFISGASEERRFELNVPNNILNKLRVVKITNFHGYMNEIEVVKFFLQTAVALESLVLVAVHHEEKDCSSTSLQNRLKNALQDLLLFPKPSSQVLIGFYKYGEEGNNFDPTHNENDWDVYNYWH